MNFQLVPRDLILEGYNLRSRFVEKYQYKCKRCNIRVYKQIKILCQRCSFLLGNGDALYCSSCINFYHLSHINFDVEVELKSVFTYTRNIYKQTWPRRKKFFNNGSIQVHEDW